MAGPATVATAVAAPDSGAESTHDSRNEWSGRMRSASALVSSMNDPKLAMNGTCRSQSPTFQAAGAAKTGLASSSSSTCGGAAASASRSARAGAGGSVAWGMNETPPSAPTLPTSAFRAFTASACARPLVCASGAPPMTATAGPYEANSRARRSIRAADTPVSFSTASGVNAGSPAAQPSSCMPARPAPSAGRRPAFITTCARPRASAPSVPGRTASHSSALAPVCDIRGSTCTNFGRLPPRPWRMAP